MNMCQRTSDGILLGPMSALDAPQVLWGVQHFMALGKLCRHNSYSTGIQFKCDGEHTCEVYC
jgi:hypothetical protein